MPTPACLRLADDVFPRVRAEAARRLVGRGWSQARAAEALGVSQAMVSRYVAAEGRTGTAVAPAQGRTRTAMAAADDALVVRLAAELVDDLHDDAPRHGPSPWCATLSPMPSRPGADEALRDLLAAERLLFDDPPLGLVPQIGMNLARALPGASHPEGVFSYPARIIAASTRLLRPAPPELGASDHLARCLLALRAHDPAVMAMASALGGPRAARAATEAGGLTVLPVRNDPDRAALFKEAVADSPSRFVHDPGAFGIEPCLYVAAPTAVEAVEALLDLHKRT